MVTKFDFWLDLGWIPTPFHLLRLYNLFSLRQGTVALFRYSLQIRISIFVKHLMDPELEELSSLLTLDYPYLSILLGLSLLGPHLHWPFKNILFFFQCFLSHPLVFLFHEKWFGSLSSPSKLWKVAWNSAPTLDVFRIFIPPLPSLLTQTPFVPLMRDLLIICLFIACSPRGRLFQLVILS